MAQGGSWRSAEMQRTHTNTELAVLCVRGCVLITLDVALLFFSWLSLSERAASEVIHDVRCALVQLRTIFCMRRGSGHRRQQRVCDAIWMPQSLAGDCVGFSCRSRRGQSMCARGGFTTTRRGCAEVGRRESEMCCGGRGARARKNNSGGSGRGAQAEMRNSRGWSGKQKTKAAHREIEEQKMPPHEGGRWSSRELRVRGGGVARARARRRGEVRAVLERVLTSAAAGRSVSLQRCSIIAADVRGLR